MRVALQTPDHPGHYVTHWQMTAPIAVKSNAEKRAGYARYGECMAVPMRVKSEYSLQQETMLAKLADMVRAWMCVCVSVCVCVYVYV